MTDEQVAALRELTHQRDCKWFDDDGWNSGTFVNYVRSFNAYPECTCKPTPEVKK